MVTAFTASPARSAECGADEVLDRLQAEVTGALEPARLAQARALLQEYCGEAVTEARAEATAQATAAVEEEVFEVFGIELRKADADSPGHNRLRKR
jgi:hypothetical protein